MPTTQVATMSEMRHLMTVPHNGHRDDETCPMCRERRTPTTQAAPDRGAEDESEDA